MSKLESIQRLFVDVIEEIGNLETVEELAEVLTELETLKSDLKLVQNDAQVKFISLMGETPEVVVNGKHVTVAHSTPRKKWDHVGLKTKVMDRLYQLSLDENGEFNLTPDDAVDKLLEFAHVDYWRAGALQDIDINPNMFCELGEEKTTVRIEDY